MSVQNILIDGTALFQDNTENAGVVETGLFDGSAVNTGTTTTAAFSGTAANHGTVVEEATFSDSAINTGTVAVAEFTGSASNAGTVTDAASFADTTTNSGIISGTATFSGSAENDGGTVAGAAVFADTAINTGSVAGPVVFSGDSVNNGTVAEAIFLGSSQNGGTVTLSAVFAENAGNLDTGLVQGNAVFADNTVNAGTIQGNAEIAATANGEQGDVAGSITTYVQPDGAFAYGYFSGGAKTAPASYATVVYQAGSFWYKYDASGNGVLASGNYSDGTSMFTFANGVKGAAYTPPNVPTLYPYKTFVGTTNDAWSELSNWVDVYGNALSALPTSSDTVLVLASMYAENLSVAGAILSGDNSVQLYAPALAMTGNVSAYGSTEIHSIDVYGNLYMHDNSHVRDAGIFGNIYLNDSATTNGNTPNATVIYMLSGVETNLDREGNSSFTSTDTGNLSGGHYEVFNGLFYQAGVPYTGSMGFTTLGVISYDEYHYPTYGLVSRTKTFANGILTNGWNPITNVYVVSGESTPLDQNGSSYWDELWVWNYWFTYPIYLNSLHNGLFYQNGIPFTGYMYNEWSPDRTGNHMTTYTNGAMTDYR
jgi:hypothetical protein